MEEEIKNEVKGRVIVPSDKFDRHMRKARVEDLRSRRRMMRHQEEKDAEREEKKLRIKGSLY